jgi:hypothetical protein
MLIKFHQIKNLINLMETFILIQNDKTYQQSGNLW